MIRLHVLPDPWGINPSPFCLKVEAYCRLAGIPFEAVPAMPFRAPRGKLPFMTDGDVVVPDSALIIEHLKRTRGDVLDAGIEPDAAAKGHLIRRTCEESLRFVLVYSRWIDPAGWRTIKPAFFGSMPPVLRDVVPALARRGAGRALAGQGYGRHSRDGIYRMGADDLAALTAILEQYPYAVGDRPTSFDASLYGVLANIISVPVETPLKDEALRHPALVAYVDRMALRLAASSSAAASSV